MTEPKNISLSGVESTGKTTLATMLVGRLRSRGVRAELVYEPGASLPFHPSYLDTGERGWIYQIAKRIERELEVSVRSNVEMVVSDRTPFDFVAYYETRFEDRSPAWRCVAQLAEVWIATQRVVYLLGRAKTTYVEDGFRAPSHQNTWRAAVADALEERLVHPNVIRVEGTYRERSEYVYHHTIATMFGETRPLRAYQQVRGWLEQRGWNIVEVRPQGSNSITRFHSPTDNDDIDMMVVVRGDAQYAIKVREDFEAHRVQMENIVQADLDVLITPQGLEAHEV